jgi:hypothetical protein
LVRLDKLRKVEIGNDHEQIGLGYMRERSPAYNELTNKKTKDDYQFEDRFFKKDYSK